MLKNCIKVLLVPILIILFVGCSETSNNSILKSLESPDKKYIAYVFERDLGATTKISNQLSILKKGEKLGNKKGNIFITYSSFDIEWSKPNELQVKISGNEDIFKQEEKFDKISIVYTN